MVFGEAAKKEARSDFACSAASEISRGTRNAEAWRAKALATSAEERYIGIWWQVRCAWQSGRQVVKDREAPSEGEGGWGRRYVAGAERKKGPKKGDEEQEEGRR